MSTEQEFARAMTLASAFSEVTLHEIEGYSEQIRQKLSETLALSERSGEPQHFELILKLSAPPMDEYMVEMERIERLYRH